MNKLFLSVMILCQFTMIISAQQPCVARQDVFIAKGKPTIYITFESLGTSKPVSARLAATGESSENANADNSTQVVRLRLHNNTRWAISFPTDSLYVGPKTTTGLPLCDGRGVLGLKEGTEVNARYEIEAERGEEMIRTSASEVVYQPIDVEAPVIHRADVLSTSWLPPGRSVIFLVPREHLAKHLMVYVPFSYQWETDAQNIGTNEPQHRVYFRSSNLPETVRR